jgi:hypothetical protein
MLGFVNPCGEGSQVDERFFGSFRDEFKKKFLSMRRARKHECLVEGHEFLPIVSGAELDPAKSSKESVAKKKKGFAMWMSHWYETLFGAFFTPSYESKMEELEESHVDSNFTKLSNGDFIKVRDLLALAGADFENPEENNRFEGLVVILNIEYSNIKENTWPNNVPPAYFYSAYVAPSSEYKQMQQDYGMRRLTYDGQKKQRVIKDYHGIFIVVKQGGYVGAFSFARVAVLIFVFMAIDSIYRSLFLCILFNCCSDHGTKKDDDEDMELDDKVTLEFKLHGEGHTEGYGRQGDEDEASASSEEER